MDNNKLAYLNENKGSRSYLVTYSKLDHKMFPTRWSFGMAVAGAFGGNTVDYFVVGKEEHEEPGFYHYHAAIRLNRPTRWKFAKTFLKENFKINVHFGVSGDMYAGAYWYATKSDKHPFIGHVLMKHPNLEKLSETYNRVIMANSTFRENCQQRELAEPAPKKTKQNRMKKGNVAMFIVENGIKNELQLLNIVTERRNLGDRCLCGYLMALQKHVCKELIVDAWRFENASQTIKDKNVDRIGKIQQHSTGQCIREECG